jgi:hypothetical protein
LTQSPLLCTNFKSEARNPQSHGVTIPNSTTVGRWGGNRLAVIGDYYRQGDLEGFELSDLMTATDISCDVNNMLVKVFDHVNAQLR